MLAKVTITPLVYFSNLAEVICESGWKAFKRSCYKISKVKRAWSEAKSDCANLGGHLLKIDNKDEQLYLLHQVRRIRISVRQNVMFSRNNYLRVNEGKYYFGLAIKGNCKYGA